MPEPDPTITELEERLDKLVRTQIDFQKEISQIRGELRKLRAAGSEPQVDRSKTSFYVPPERPKDTPHAEQPKSETERPTYPQSTREVPPPSFAVPVEEPKSASGSAFSDYVSNYAESAKADLEKFIGENLISKIGIIVLVLGVGIGAKYAIDNNLISPLTRIIIGHIFGFGLIGLAIKLKPKYHNFSAVLMSGGMAIMYFVTFFAYSSYELISQLSAFALMAMFTVFTVTSALLYNRQVIAHIGLVGAYAVPFLLSNDSGNYLVLFIYVAILNLGILAISIKKYWKPLFYTSSVFTWMIYGGWFATKYNPAEHFYLALAFLAVFFGIFYATKLVQKYVHEEDDDRENLASALATGFVFYVFSFAIESREPLNSQVFFAYVALITAVILVTSFRTYGRAFVYLSFPLVWLIYGVWFSDIYNPAEDFYVAAGFATIFFATFYLSVLAHRLMADNFSLIEHTTLVLSNSFIFYGFGYSILDGHQHLRNFLGPYTVAHAAMHLAVAFIVNKVRSSAADVVQVLTILILTFTSIAVPVQFDGNFVTMIWAVEAALLFWMGRTRSIRLFEYFSFPVMVLATGSMLLDWFMSFRDRNAYSSELTIQPLANGDFITAAVFVAAFAFIYVTNRDDRYEPAIPVDLVRPVGLTVAAVGTFVLYNMFRLEIENYFHLRALRFRSDSLVIDRGPYEDLEKFNLASQLNYTLVFLTAVAAMNLKRIRSTLLAFLNSGMGAFTLAVFATIGMFAFSELRQSYVTANHEPVFPSFLYIAIRPISYLIAGGLLYSLYRYSRDELTTEQIPQRTLLLLFEGLAYTFVFIVASCELVNLMGQYRIPDATKLGLSILWGVYALALIIIGIGRNKKHLRVAAFVLLAVTLAKLFLYDVADLETIPKTILFVTLGITLLVISFLYNKYKGLIFETEANQEE